MVTVLYITLLTSGFVELWGTDIVNCVCCGGYEHKDKSCATIGLRSDMELDSALKAFSVTSSVHLFPHLEDPDLVPVEIRQKLSLLEVGGITIMPFKHITSISKDSPGELVIHLSDGSEHRVGWILYEPKTYLSTPLLCCQLGVELNGKGGIRVGPFYETNVSGVFAAGDCVNMAKHVPAAINDGLIAGEAVHLQLTMQDLEDAASTITM